jgi:hypothetical protein
MADGQFVQSKPSGWHLTIGWLSPVFVLAAGRTFQEPLGEFDS